MKLSGWGRWPVADARIVGMDQLANGDWPCPAIARGLGRSYGDAALGENVIASRTRARMLAFDERTGELRCEAGVSLAEIIQVFLPRGWFIPVTPGTRFVTIGGAIASDVHGKNHHRDGCFSNFVTNLLLLLPDGRRLSCGPGENTEIFRATCGGMGLTGVIAEATVRLMRVPGGRIRQRTLKAGSLDDAMALFEANSEAPYSVAWIDCLAKGGQRGRSLLYVGEHCEGAYRPPQSVTWKRMPFDMPSFTLNRFTVAAFNELYYRMGSRKAGEMICDIEPFFYPLDAIGDWNRMYSSRGFFQYQCVVPLATAQDAFDAMLRRISAAGKGSFLAVLKRMGQANDNLLSFPLEGYTLALDFPNDAASRALIRELDRITVDHGGRIYLAKDALLSPEDFRAGYPRWEEFVSLRQSLGVKGRVESALSRRLEI